MSRAVRFSSQRQDAGQGDSAIDHSGRTHRSRRRQRNTARASVTDAAATTGLDPQCVLQDIPVEARLKLQSEEGDIFEVSATHLCRHSFLVRSIVDDSGFDEEIPLPGISTRALSLLLAHFETCSEKPTCRKGGLRAPQHDSLCDLQIPQLLEVHSGARLLHMESLDKRVLVCLARQLGEQAALPELGFDVFLWMLRDGASYLTPAKLQNLITSLCTSCPPAYETTLVRTVGLYVENHNQEVRWTAVASLQAIGTVEALCVLLKCSDFVVRSRAGRALPHGCPRALSALLLLIEHDAFQVRETAVKSLARQAQRGDARVLSELVKMLEDPSREVRDAVVQSLEVLIGSETSEITARVVQLLTHDDWPVQSSALRALAIVAQSEPVLVKAAALKLMQSSATRSRHVAAGVLQELARAESPAIDLVDANAALVTSGASLRSDAESANKRRGVSICGNSWADSQE